MKFFKKLGLCVLLFLVIMYFIGSCTERPEYKPKDEGSTPVYTEVTPDEYEAIMNKAIQRKNNSASIGLTAHASLSEFGDEVLDNFLNFTNFYKVSDWTNDYFNYLRDPDNYFDKEQNLPPVGNSTDTDPVTSYVIPQHYNFYCKQRINYPNNTFEIVVCSFDSDLQNNTSVKRKTGHITITRNSSEGYSTSFGFDVCLATVTHIFNSSSGVSLRFFPLTTGVTGIDTTSQDFKRLTNGSINYVYFNSLLTNDIYTNSTSSSSAIKWNEFISDNTSVKYINYSFSQVVTNDYNLVASINNYQSNVRNKSVNLYYNNRAGDTVTVNNYNKYADYGYTYNSVTGSLEIDPDVISGYFNASIKPSLDVKFDNLFSAMPDIGVTIENYTGELNNLIEIMFQLTSTESTSAVTGTYPVMTGDINVNVTVDVTFPEEFYRKYPALTTEPAFVAENPDIDFALDVPLPLEILDSSAHILTIASDFITDSGLMPLYIMCIALGLVSLFLL